MLSLNRKHECLDKFFEHEFWTIETWKTKKYLNNQNTLNWVAVSAWWCLDSFLLVIVPFCSITADNRLGATPLFLLFPALYLRRCFDWYLIQTIRLRAQAAKLAFEPTFSRDFYGGVSSLEWPYNQSTKTSAQYGLQGWIKDSW